MLNLKEEFKSNSIDNIQDYISNYASSQNSIAANLNSEQRLELIEQLKENGLLNLKGSVTITSKLLNVSRTTIYKILSNVK